MNFKKLVVCAVYFLFCYGMAALDGNAASDQKPTESNTPVDNGATRLILELFDGSRIAGIPETDGLRLKSKYSEIEVQFSKIHTIEFASETDRAARVNLQNGDLINATLSVTEIPMKTAFGRVAIPMGQISAIRVQHAATGKGKALPAGLVVCFSFDADEGGRTSDLSGNGCDGKILGAEHIKEGKDHGAIKFNGTRQAVVVEKNIENLQLQDFTIMAWIKRDNLEKASNTWKDGVVFTWGRAGFAFAIDAAGRIHISKTMISEAVYSTDTIHDKLFHHVAVTKKGGKILFYIDGVANPAPDYNAIFEFTSDAVAVGATPDGKQEACFLGTIDEVAVFKRPLSEEEVKKVYESQK